MKLQRKLKNIFLEQINRRIIPHMRNADYAVSPSIILEVPITMTDNEDPPHFKRLQPDTKRMTVHLKSGAERNKFFDEVKKSGIILTTNSL